jgi:hypothetical protein
MVMVLATATLTAPADSTSQGLDHAAVALALLFLGTLGLPLTFRMVPLVVEAAVVAGAGASVLRRTQRGATRLAAAAPIGGASRLAASRPTSPHQSGSSLPGGHVRPMPSPGAAGRSGPRPTSGVAS